MKKKKFEKAFLPVSKDEMVERGWYYYDFLVVTADAYIDHPSFGTAIIARVLEHEGYRVAVLAQPDWHSADAFRAMGRPRYGVMIGGGNIDSMVAHYTAAKKHRTSDLYSPGSKMGLRPDRPTIVYANRCREAFGDIPIVVGGLEASLRRFAHYDYWDDKVRRALIFDAQADLLVYGMGEYATRAIARRLAKGEKVDALTDIRGTAFVTRTPEVCAFDHVDCPSYEEVCADKRAYALATKLEYEEHDPIRGKALWQAHGRDTLVVNPPAMPLSREELCDIILQLVREEGVSVLFSTHITSDLMRIADDIVYISQGKVLAACPLRELLDKYKLAQFASFAAATEAKAIGVKPVKDGYEGLVNSNMQGLKNAIVMDATIDNVMVHLEKANREERHAEFN